MAFFATISATVLAANGVLFRAPRNPQAPLDPHAIILPEFALIVINVVL